MLLFLTLVAVPIVFCMISWVVFTTSRIYRFEDTHAAEQYALQARRRIREAAATSIAIGSAVHSELGLQVVTGYNRSYQLRYDKSSGIPSLWHDELWTRRN
jgi:hypothetical protein